VKKLASVCTSFSLAFSFSLSLSLFSLSAFSR
jgi:hypothetical protein